MDRPESTMNGPNNNWIAINKCQNIDETVKILHCDTRDFHVIMSDHKPELFKNAECGYEIAHNAGLGKLYKIFKKKDRSDYAMQSSQIIPWLIELCEKAGGISKDWRCLCSDVDKCRNWELKYIRFVRNLNEQDEFIVCNAYMDPVKWKDIIANLKHYNYS